MKLRLCALLGICLLLESVVANSVEKEEEEESGIFECFLKANSASCARKKIAEEIDRIELNVSGKKSDVPMSVVLEETGNFVAETLSNLFGTDNAENGPEEEDTESRAMNEGRKNKLLKKKKKHFMKLVPLALLLKSKLSFLLQLISTHLSIKFFIVAVIGLMINIARFWLDLKKSHHPSKVIYYEHAQHQHHYDHEDEHGGYWGRSIDEAGQDAAQNLAYKAYAPEYAPAQ